MKIFLRIIEDTLPIVLGDVFASHEATLVSIGWNVVTHYAPAREKRAPYATHIALAKDVVWPFLRQNPGAHVFLVGNVHLGNTGNYTLNEIPSDWGAMPSSYLVLPDIPWTDQFTNNTGLLRARLNVPGDGHFDQENLAAATPQGCLGVLDFSRHVPKQWGSLLDPDHFQIECYRRYFTRLLNYRAGLWAFKTNAGAGHYKGGGAGEFGIWAENAYGSFVKFGPPKVATDIATVNDYAPFKFISDFKSIGPTAAIWSAKPDPWAFFDLSFGSGQAAPDSARIVNPMLAGALLSSSGIHPWSLDMFLTGSTAGEVWRDTMIKARRALYLILNGDPTLTLTP